MGSLPVNIFDAVIYLCLTVAVIMGFKSGLLRVLTTILSYAAATAVTLAVVPFVTWLFRKPPHVPPTQTWLILVVLFVAAVIVINALLHYLVGQLTGPDIGIVDRMLGATLGAVRVVFLAVLIAVIFDRLIPPRLEPPFLAGSKLRPILSEAGRQGLQSLPPEIETYIERIKRERRI